jgi:hypothetical protein
MRVFAVFSIDVIRHLPPLFFFEFINQATLQILGVTEKDEVVKAAMELKIAGIEDGYTAEVSTCRQVADWILELCGCVWIRLTHKYIIIPVFIVALLLLFFGQELLVDVRDKLLFEQEYAGSIKEKVPHRSSLHIPWSWLPAVLCVLQEVIQTLLVKTFTRTTK